MVKIMVKIWPRALACWHHVTGHVTSHVMDSDAGWRGVPWRVGMCRGGWGDVP